MSAKDQQFRMWPFWRDKKGYEAAAADYYPNSFRHDPQLARALAMIQDGKALADARMAELTELEPEDDQES